MTLTMRALASLAGTALVLAVAAATAGEPSRWDEIREMLFEGRTLEDAGGLLELEAPQRALDAALVPVRVRAAEGVQVRTFWLVIDENPAPLAAVVHLDPAKVVPDIETRVRVNAYTPFHAVAETADGGLLVAERFVKAAGGCSAPGTRDPKEALARVGRMKLRAAGPVEPGKPATFTLKIAHPNYTGLQIDQLTRQWIPPDYVTRVTVRVGGEPVLVIDGDISISEDPTFTFTLREAPAGEIRVEVEDSSGRRFAEDFRPAAAEAERAAQSHS
ncbi:hypothetical protein HRbin39_00852 [bacterium HR39]|nr:hypothetical protein HRbin39_00852 [bacterium HR39]